MATPDSGTEVGLPGGPISINAELDSVQKIVGEAEAGSWVSLGDDFDHRAVIVRPELVAYLRAIDPPPDDSVEAAVDIAD
jgi:hypothetical protein